MPARILKRTDARSDGRNVGRKIFINTLASRKITEGEKKVGCVESERWEKGAYRRIKFPARTKKEVRGFMGFYF